MSELLGSPLPRILVNSAVPSIPVASQFVVNSSTDVCDTPVLSSMAVLDSATVCLCSPAQVAIFYPSLR